MSDQMGESHSEDEATLHDDTQTKTPDDEINADVRVEPRASDEFASNSPDDTPTVPRGSTSLFGSMGAEQTDSDTASSGQRDHPKGDDSSIPPLANPELLNPIRDLERLRGRGILSDEEFESKKRLILDDPTTGEIATAQPDVPLLGETRAEGSGTETPAPTRVCPRCSVQSTTEGEFCPQCGASFTRRRRSLTRRGKWIGVALLAVLILGGAGTGLALKMNHDHHVRAQARAAAARAKTLADEAAAQAVADDAARSTRHEYVRALESSVLKDARSQAKTGVLTGPITRVSCTPLGGGSTDDLTALTGTFQCIAVNKRDSDGTESGYVFSATINWNDGSYSWRLGV